jgi:hypothetical protein
MPLANVADVVPSAQCARCGLPAIEGWVVWELPMCNPCVAVWREAAPDAGTVAAAVGWDNLVPEYTRRTAAWAKRGASK